MQNTDCNTLPPPPQLIVLPDSPVLLEAMKELKQVVSDAEYFTIKEYLEWRDRHELTDEVALPHLQKSGYGFVKSASGRFQNGEEVIVDLRFLAAAMLLIYSDPKFALRHSVLTAVNQFYHFGSEELHISVSGSALDDAYATYGHHFTYMDMADHANFELMDNRVDEAAFIMRHIHSLNELIKSEEEMTAVFHLCIDVMYVVNTGQAAGKLYRTYKGSGQAYKHFWRMACIIRDRARGTEKRAAVCADPYCEH